MSFALWTIILLLFNPITLLLLNPIVPFSERYFIFKCKSFCVFQNIETQSWGLRVYLSGRVPWVLSSGPQSNQPDRRQKADSWLVSNALCIIYPKCLKGIFALTLAWFDISLYCTWTLLQTLLTNHSSLPSMWISVSFSQLSGFIKYLL